MDFERTPAAGGLPGETAGWRTLPNLLTALRMVLIAPFVWLAVRGDDLAALGIWIVAGLTDTLDGHFARRLRQSSQFGRLADPLADKLLTGAAFIVLAVFRGGLSAIPMWLMAAVIARDILILLGSLLVYSAVRNSGFRPTFLGKLNTLIELLVVTWFLAATRFPALAPALPALYAAALVSIAASALDYLVQGLRMVRREAGKP
ncbi:MAG: CDP-alcohol phosphatidyltransferase family protein [Acidobacteriia bacterium]|nr:CDP-alcohol phosphatidyltransferase family protein [Terriglobia bacterium]